MTNRDLIQQLKSLKPINPSADWQAKNREVLLMQIKSQKGEINKAPSLHLLEIFSIFISSRYVKFALAQIVVFGIILGSIFGGGITTSLAEVSLPGDVLYPVKIIVEKAQLTFASGEENKMKIQSEIAGKRLTELTKIANKPEEDQKPAQVKKAVQNFQKEVNAVKTRLEKIEKDSSVEKAVEVAKVVTEKTKDFEKTLSQTKEAVSVEAKNDLSKAQATVNEAGDKALEVLVSKHQETDKISSQEVAGLIEEKIEATKQKIEEEPSCDSSQGKVITIYPSSVLLPPGATASVLGDQVLVTLPSRSSQPVLPEASVCAAKEKLKEARKELEKQDLPKALEKTTEATKIVQEAEKQNLDLSGGETKSLSAESAQSAESASSSSSLQDDKTRSLTQERSESIKVESVPTKSRD